MIKNKSSLRSGVAWTGTGNFIYFACQYGMLMAVAKFADPAAVGRFALALAITAPVVIFSQMQLRQLQVTDVNGEVAFRDYVRHRLVLTGAACLIIAAIAAAYPAATGIVIGLVGVAKAFESVSDIAYGRLQRYERMDLIALSMIIKGVLSLGVFTLVIARTGSLIWGVAGLASVWAAVLLLFDIPSQRLMGTGGATLPGEFGSVKRLTALALPLAWTSALVSLSANVPRYILDGLYGQEAVAIFSVAATPLLLANMAVGSLSQAALPRAATYFQSGQLDAFHRLSLRITYLNIAVGLTSALVFAVAGRELVTIFFTAEYLSAVPLMVIMAVGTAIGGIGAYGAMVLSAGRRFSLQFYNVLMMTCLQGVVGYVLIHSYGVAGAGWAELMRYAASAAFLLIAGFVVMQKQQQMMPSTQELWLSKR